MLVACSWLIVRVNIYLHTLARHYTRLLWANVIFVLFIFWTIPEMSNSGQFQKCLILDYFRISIFWTNQEFSNSKQFNFFLYCGTLHNLFILDHSITYTFWTIQQPWPFQNCQIIDHSTLTFAFFLWGGVRLLDLYWQLFLDGLS